MTALFRNRLSFLIIAFVFGGFILFIFFNSLPYNPLQSTSGIAKIVVKSILPESWGFFTRNPQETKLFVYKEGISDFYLDPLQKQSSAPNFFGIKRTAKKYSMIFQNISSLLSWDSCYANDFHFFNTLNINKNVVTVKNYEKDYINKGKYLLVRKKTTPWAWRSQEGEIKQMLYYKVLNFQ